MGLPSDLQNGQNWCQEGLSGAAVWQSQTATRAGRICALWRPHRVGLARAEQKTTSLAPSKIGSVRWGRSWNRVQWTKPNRCNGGYGRCRWLGRCRRVRGPGAWVALPSPAVHDRCQCCLARITGALLGRAWACSSVDARPAVVWRLGDQGTHGDSL